MDGQTCVGYPLRHWILLAAPNSSVQASGQNQLRGPWGRVLAHDLTRWIMTGKEVGSRDRLGGRKGVRREVGKMDGRLLELEAGSCGGGCL